jgi:hypothetical protein
MEHGFCGLEFLQRPQVEEKLQTSEEITTLRELQPWSEPANLITTTNKQTRNFYKIWRNRRIDSALLCKRRLEREGGRGRERERERVQRIGQKNSNWKRVFSFLREPGVSSSMTVECERMATISQDLSHFYVELHGPIIWRRAQPSAVYPTPKTPKLWGFYSLMTIDCEQRARIFQYFLISSLRLIIVLIWFQKLQNHFCFSNQLVSKHNHFWNLIIKKNHITLKLKKYNHMILIF